MEALAIRTKGYIYMEKSNALMDPPNVTIE